MLFKEEQYVRHSRVGKISLASLLLLLLSLIIIDFFNRSANNGLMIIIELTATLFPFLLIWNSKLSTRIDDNNIKYKYSPYNWKLREVKWSQVSSVQIRKYSPLKEFGGFGYRKKLFKKSI